MLKNNINIPLCVDLDGTLIAEDCAVLSFKKYITKNWQNIFIVAYWVYKLKNCAAIKEKLSAAINIPFKTFTIIKPVLDFIIQEKKQGRDIYLVTGADKKYALVIAQNLKLFKNVYASDGKTNLVSYNKADLLINKFGAQAYIYIGNSKQDLPVWEQAASVILSPLTPQKIKQQIKNLDKNIIIL